MKYIFKRKTKNFVKILKNDMEPLIIKMNTIAKSKIYIENIKQYLNILINNDFKKILEDIKNQSECFLECKTKYKNNMKEQDILRIKIDDQIKIMKNGIYVLKNTIQPEDKLEINLELSFIWMNEHMWGFTWKTKYIKLN